MNAELLFEARAQLGEGAIWNADSNKLYWVDIEKKTFNVFDIHNLSNKSYPTGKKVGTVVPVADAKHIMVALEDGIAFMDLDSGELEYKLSTDIHLEHNRRFNDGKCDPAGRFWVGTLSMNGVKEVSSLYCIDSDFNLSEKLTGISISNGIIWSPDGTRMYYTDTPTGKIWEFDFDKLTGSLISRKLIIEIQDTEGYPDGMTIDAEGMLWVALWDGFAVARFDPASGQLLEKIYVPAPKVTSCTFGGDNLDTLLITTASVEMSEEEKEKFPLSGSIFKANAGVKGIHAHKFRYK